MFHQKPIQDVFDNKFLSFHQHAVLNMFTKARCHSSHLQTVSPTFHFNIILPSNLHLPRRSQPHLFQPTHFLAHPPLCALNVPFISLFLIETSQQYMAENKNFEDPPYAIFSGHLSLRFNTELNTLFSNTLNLYSSVWLKNQASKPHKM